MPLGRVDWTALARGLGLQVRHFSPGLTGVPLVVVDTTGVPSAPALDWTARTAAGFILTLAQRGGCRVLLPGDSNETSITGVNGEWRALHRRLATLAPSRTSVALPPRGHASAIRVRATSAPVQADHSPQLPVDVVAIETPSA
jgi:uncharacterized protein (DUF58 family)